MPGFDCFSSEHKFSVYTGVIETQDYQNTDNVYEYYRKHIVCVCVCFVMAARQQISYTGIHFVLGFFKKFCCELLAIRKKNVDHL